MFRKSMMSIDFCESEDMDGIIQWYTDVYKFVNRNKNLYKRLDDLDEKLQKLEKENKLIMEKLEQQQESSNKEIVIQRLIEKLEEQEERVCGEIVIQRRIDGSGNFYRTWEEYKQGFGNKGTEFLIGLERLHKLTNSRPYELLIVLEDFENDRRYAKYDNFVVASETQKYKLHSLGQYSGTAGDSLTFHLGYNFTTKDQDNDEYSGNCAELFTGAWWYRDCHVSYLKGNTTRYAEGVVWNEFRGQHYSLKFVEMSIRPK
ncbi:ficolin-1-like isoform X2 [Musca autumnalis]|uniref:ficolin-1-like isoform X2 n=1 Tax=Musca autumnalis TaxID=221902 RepID=UPI003CF1025B